MGKNTISDGQNERNKYYTMGELQKEFEKRYSEFISEKKFREKISEMFDVFNIETVYLKNPEGDFRDYCIPDESVEFMYELYGLYATPEGIEIRKGHWSNVSMERLDWVINGFSDMLKLLEVPDQYIESQIKLIKSATDYDFLHLKNKLRNIFIDALFEMDLLKEGEKEYLEKGRIDNGFSYRFLKKDDLITLYKMINDDAMEMQIRHHGIYNNFAEIRKEELYSKQYPEDYSEEELELIDLAFDQKYLVEDWEESNERYMELNKEFDYWIQHKGFIVPKKRALDRIMREQYQITQEIIDRELDGEMLDLSELFQVEGKTSGEALKEAVERYNRQTEEGIS